MSRKRIVKETVRGCRRGEDEGNMDKKHAGILVKYTKKIPENAPDSIFSIATGYINVLDKRSRQVRDDLIACEGFIGQYQDKSGLGILWFYDSENNAKGARNIITSKGAHVGYNIVKFDRYGESWTPDVKWAEEHCTIPEDFEKSSETEEK